MLIYLTHEEYSRVEKVLKELCKKHNAPDVVSWQMRAERPLLGTGRPKLELLTDGVERLSAIPVYKTDQGVGYKLNSVFILPDCALIEELRIINSFRFYTPPKDIIQRLVLIIIGRDIARYRGQPIEKILNGKRMVDARAIFTSDEYNQIVRRFEEKAQSLLDRRKSI